MNLQQEILQAMQAGNPHVQHSPAAGATCPGHTLAARLPGCAASAAHLDNGLSCGSSGQAGQALQEDRVGHQ